MDEPKIAHTVDPRLKIEIQSWPEDVQVEFEERAAILEYDGGYSRLTAEHLAYQEIKDRLSTRSQGSPGPATRDPSDRSR